MAKKSNKGRTPRLSPAQMVRPARERGRSQEGGDSRLPELQEEYRYVVRDLRRIAVIAAVMLVVMIALALVVV